MKIEKWSADTKEQTRLLARAELLTDPQLETNIRAIVDNVQTRGDEAVRMYRERFDGVRDEAFRVPEAELKQAYDALTPELRAALIQAKDNLTAFHVAQRPQPIFIETMPGVQCEMVWRAIDRVGLYVPAGTAPLFSALLMLAVPAKLAGCEKIILCTPPQKNGRIDPSTMAAAYLCGMTEIYALGGAYAIAAMAFGTEQVPKVDKILGPGNAYVTMAKQLVSLNPNGAAIDMPAGPSEVMVIAGPSARADWVAADLLAQAEHDVVSQAMLLTTDADFAERVIKEMSAQMQKLPRRNIIEKSLQISRAILVDSMQQAIDVANQYAPEHLILSAPDDAKWVDKINNAGSVFVGPYTCETGGDYASGTNHVLPNFGAARAYGGLSLYSFLRSMTVQSVSQRGLQSLAPTLVCLARAENLDAHAAAVTLRTKAGEEKI